jgi:hypothetical protein
MIINHVSFVDLSYINFCVITYVDKGLLFLPCLGFIFGAESLRILWEGSCWI